ncbi:hypothetical protein KBA41_17865 [Candidatus Ozemobacteraceae bacterium]|nr:hypothetical protein [Candidatus Ozemobacteraceae bacterium]
MDQAEGYKIFAKALREQFSSHPYENEVLLMLLIPTLLILVWLYLTMSPSRRRSITSSTKRDIDFFETAATQKGLESFDRELLRSLAETANIHPIYRVILERRSFEKALRISEEALAEGHPDAPERKTLDYLRRLQRRLFLPSMEE